MDLLQLTNSLPSNILFEIGFVIILATILAYLARLSKQPLIPAYIIAGIILGPIGLGLIKDYSLIRALSEIGIAFLLFVVGLEINTKKLKEVSLISLVGGFIQVLLVFITGFFISIYIGFDQISSIYLGLVMAFSSTMLVIKLLADKEEINTLHGRIIIGFLLVQDLLVILALIFLNSTDNLLSLLLINISLLKSILIIIAIFLATRYIAPIFLKYAAKTKELLFLTSLAILFLFTLLSYIFNFSIAIGSFVAGIGMASTHYAISIKSRVEPIKDFFATIFFVSLGMQLVLINFNKFLEPLIIFFLIVILLKPIIIFFITLLFGFQNKNSFLTSISLGQVSEFSLILVAEGLILGKISQDIFSITIILAISTMILTSYLIKNDIQIYSFFSRLLSRFDKLSLIKRRLGYTKKGVDIKIILFGCHRMGFIFLETFKRSNKNVIVVDHNPEVISALVKQKISCMYGDMASKEILDNLNLRDKEIIVSTIPNDEENMFLIEYTKSINPNLIVIVTSHHLGQAFDLYDYGADYVIIPQLLGGEIISRILKKIIKSKREIKQIKKQHLKYLEKFKLFG